MALPITGKYDEFIIALGDGAAPPAEEAFARSCLLRTEKAVQVTQAVSETPIHDCDDSTIAAWLERETTSNSMTISGTGKLDFAEFNVWMTWAVSKNRKNIQAQYNKPVAQNGGYLEGAFLLTSFETTASTEDQGGLIMATIELQSTGPVTWTPAT